MAGIYGYAKISMYMKFIFTFIIIVLALSFPKAFASVEVVQSSDQQWQLKVDGEPYFIKGIDYRVTKIGQSPDQGTLEDWAYYDVNHNGIVDGPYEAWVDRNFNGTQEVGEPNVGDFELMRQMGANTIRWYVNDFKEQKANKQILRDLFNKYGMRVAVGNKFGAYTIDSGATWEEGTDYRDTQQQERMLESIRKMVLEHKDEPYTLMWLIGNENNYHFTNTNANKFPEVYAQFVNEATKLIHELDNHQHPVALVNGDTKFLSIYQTHCPDIDIFAVNAYRGTKGFGSLWKEVKRISNRPILISEYGGASAALHGENSQAAYHRNAWLDIWSNRYGAEGEGNAIGGFAFEWLDEWWKAGEPALQASPGTMGKQGLDRPVWAQEYSGIASQGHGQHSPFLRQLRKVYYLYKEIWNN